MKDINVLVFPCGSEIGLELFRSLKDIRFIHLYGASSVDDHGMWLYKNYVGGVPYVTDPSCVDKLNEIIDQYEIDCIFPAMDSVILALSEQREKLHAKLLTSPADAVKVCRSKSETYKRLADCPFIPRTYQYPSEVDFFPVLVKPAVGQGSQGVIKIMCKNDLKQLLSARTEEQVICEFLPGEEYTVECFTDRHGSILYSKARLRRRIKSGISVNSEVMAEQDSWRTIAEQISTHLQFRGAWFFQMKRDKNGELKLLECATRIAGTMCLQRALGINLPLLTIMDAMDMDVSVLTPIESACVDRALCNVFRLNLEYKHLYIDFDDTLTVHGTVNKEALWLLYQCVEQKIPITLLTCHQGNIHLDMQKMHIPESLFDMIIEVPENKMKSDYINNSEPALFIDDSYRERLDVWQQRHIPVLGVESIEALLDYHQ